MSLVLVVDDQEETCRLTVRLIRLLGAAAESVRSGAEAVAFVTERRPDLVLLDICMPEMDGLETLLRLRSRVSNDQMPVVMLTALSDDGSRHAAAAAGA